MASEYVRKRLAELGPRPKGPPPRLMRLLYPASRRQLRVAPTSRTVRITQAGTDYVRKVRASAADSHASWFDVAAAYQAGLDAAAKSPEPQEGKHE